MQLHIIPAVDIIIRTNRQRRQFDQAKILELAGSIADSGLLHPIVVRKADGEYTLVAGERRLKALEHLWFLGSEVHCGKSIIPEGSVPAVFLGEISDLEAEEAELEENIKREDLSWQERADATARLDSLRARQAELEGKEAPSITDITRELNPDISPETPVAEFASTQAATRQDIILGRALQKPDLAKVIEKAASRKEAIKLLKRHEETQRSAAHSAVVGANYSTSLHCLRQGDCIPVMSELPEASFDVILTDPPYGIGADDFSDSVGKAAGSHFYDDSYESWRELVKHLPDSLSRVAKAAAHAYVFCDVTRFNELATQFRVAGWRVFRTPLIWVNPGAMRAPWPEQGPQRKYQCILYAVRGDKAVTKLQGDVLTYSNDENLGHPAQKPVALYQDLLNRSARAGDSVLDPFCGSGTIFPAAHSLKIRATGIELDAAAHGLAAKRLAELK